MSDDASPTHDPSCRSSSAAWQPRPGGFTDMCELWDCPGCGVTFQMSGASDDGLHFEPDSAQSYLAEGDHEWYDAVWCDCCWQRRMQVTSSE